MLPKLLLPSVISIVLLTAINNISIVTSVTSTNLSTSTGTTALADSELILTTKTTTAAAAAEKTTATNSETTTSLLPLQPPLNLTSTTTTTASSFFHLLGQEQAIKDDGENGNKKEKQKSKHEPEHLINDEDNNSSSQHHADNNNNNKNNSNDNKSSVTVKNDNSLLELTENNKKKSTRAITTRTATTTPTMGNSETKKHLIYGYFIGRSNDSSFQQRHEYQNATSIKGSYQVQLPDGDARTQVDYVADETGYHPVVRYESKDDHSSVTGHFSLDESHVPNSELNPTTPNLPANSQGYVHFELNYENEAERQENRKSKKLETVNQVLTNLFPNGFTDIFRFSYASEPSTTTEIPLVPPNSQTTVGAEPEVEVATEMLEPEPRSSSEANQNKTIYSYETSVTAEYRREISPGHMQIVVEKLALPTGSIDDFNDGSNHITRDELMRINRAARDAPVLPSLLVEPNKTNNTNGQIVILRENSDELEDMNEDEDDNQIAESQHIAQHLYQRLLPETVNSYPYKNDGDYKDGQVRTAKQEQQINVHIVHDNNLRPAQSYSQNYFTPTAEFKTPLIGNQNGHANPNQELDHFQENAELNFKQRQAELEAPSRQFLKHFNPILSESSNAPIPRGNFHYETNAPKVHTVQQQQQQQQTANTFGDYSQQYKPAAQLVYQQEQLVKQQKQQIVKNAQPILEALPLHTNIQHSQVINKQSTPIVETAQSKQQQTDKGAEKENATPKSTFFVTLNTPQQQIAPALEPSHPAKTPHDYVSEAAAEASQTLPQHVPEPNAAKPNEGYTYVEVQKSVNIRNKLITEKDGKLVEQHETIYPQPQYVAALPAAEATQQLHYEALQEQQAVSPKYYVSGVQSTHYEVPQIQPVSTPQQNYISPPQEVPHEVPETQPAFSPKDYVSLSANPIHVQHIDYETEPQEEAASHTNAQHAPPPAAPQHSQQEHIHYSNYVVHPPDSGNAPAPPENTQQSVHIVKETVAQQTPVANVKEYQNVKTQYYADQNYVNESDAAPAVQQIVEATYHAPAGHYAQHAYPVQGIVEKHVPVPYPVPEPVPVPVHVEHFIDRPYPVETIVEKPIPYPVETIVEKVVEKPVEKIVNKYIDRPIAVPIHVPVAIRMPSFPHRHHGSPSFYPPHVSEHPNALGWSQQLPDFSRIPDKVLQNYYTRMLKKHVPLMTTYRTTTTAPVQKELKTQQTTKSTSTTPKPTYRITDIRFDLKPPPPPLGSSWLNGARYIYNTLPHDLSISAASAPAQYITEYTTADLVGQSEPYDEFQRWRNGHSLKRSPSFGRNLHVEYGFKPPLVPSIEIDENGIPLNANLEKTDE